MLVSRIKKTKIDETPHRQPNSANNNNFYNLVTNSNNSGTRNNSSTRNTSKKNADMACHIALAITSFVNTNGYVQNWTK